jgi:hypothetical protein
MGSTMNCSAFEKAEGPQHAFQYLTSENSSVHLNFRNNAFHLLSLLSLVQRASSNRISAKGKTSQ